MATCTREFTRPSPRMCPILFSNFISRETATIASPVPVFQDASPPQSLDALVRNGFSGAEIRKLSIFKSLWVFPAPVKGTSSAEHSMSYPCTKTTNWARRTHLLLGLEPHTLFPLIGRP